ncbi:MAG: molybdopterin-synthase adenylyltransferase MoeB [Flavobacteriales bacterium]|nr:molybdopterin-synthase adenylyltransferase MoeB [Flavobacteriales bacterium]
MVNPFTKAELERYSRHLIIPEFNLEGQRKLKEAKVLVIGSGGLGSPMLMYLAAAGVGHIGIVDFDVIEDHNLQRQVLFDIDQVGASKAQSAKERILGLNPHIDVTVHETRITSENALELIEQYDVVADGTDNFPTRYLVNDACVLAGKTNVYASIYRFEGQCSVFNHLRPDGSRGPNYRDLFPSPPPPGLVPSCSEGGVIGVLPGILGSLQALEVIKVISGVGDVLDGRLFLFDAATFGTRTLKVRPNAKNPLTGEHPTQTELIDYEMFCGLGGAPKEERPVKEISPAALDAIGKQGEAPVLIDVREPYEFAIAEMGGVLMPVDSVPERLTEIPKDRPVVIHCRSGVRSARVIRMLEDQHGYDNLLNLKGGILGWQEDVDPSLARY